MSRRGENIYKRKDGRWEGRYIKNRICNKAQYGYVYAHSYQEVKEKLYSEKMNARKAVIKNKEMKFSELCGLWFLSQKANLKASTVQRYSSMLNNHIIPFFNNSYVSEITTCSLTAFVAYLRESSGLSEKTAAGTLSLVKAVFRYGEMINVKHSCVLSAVTVKVKSKEMRVLSQDEYIRLTTFLSQETDTYSVGILLALMTGIRIGELCALRYSDIDMNNKRIQISKTMQRLNDSSGKGTYISIDKPKSSSSVRIIPVPEILLEIINKQNYNEIRHFIENQGGYIKIERGYNCIVIRPEYLFLLIYEGANEKSKDKFRIQLKEYNEKNGFDDVMTDSERSKQAVELGAGFFDALIDLSDPITMVSGVLKNVKLLITILQKNIK